MVYPIIIVVLFLLTGATIAYLLNSGNKKNSPRQLHDISVAKNGKKCIICNRGMLAGEKMFSKEIKREDDSIVYMYGCSHCKDNPDALRICPVCKRELNSSTYLLGRMWFRKKSNKKHLRISGCIHCSRLKLS